MNDHQRQLRRGFNWLGGATIVARLVDFGTILVMLLWLTKQQVGIASLVVSIGMVVEAFNGLGTSEALIQATSVSRRQLDTLFWYIGGAALLVGGLTLLAAPWIAALYGIAGLGTYFLAVAAKQPLVGAAVIPLAMLSRNLQFRRIAIINVCATLAAAAIRLALGASGAGAWALVAGYAASGLFVLIGVSIVQPFRPRLRFETAAILPLARFGYRAAAANVSEQMFKNVDYMLVGWFYGPSALAVYRVAFDVAMEPAMAVGTLVNRTAMPVIARVAADGARLTETLCWSLHRIAILVAPLMAGLMLAAGPLTSLLHDSHGNSYAAAAMPLRVLAVAALLRITLLLLSTVMIASGRPGQAARLSLTSLLLLASGILAVGLGLDAARGLTAVSAVWLAIYPVLLVWGAGSLRRFWQVPVRDMLRAFVVPSVAVAVLLPIGLLIRLLVGAGHPPVRLGLAVAATALTYAAVFLHERRRPACFA